MVTVGWLSEAVEKIWDFLVGTTVFLEISLVITPPTVSMPRVKGQTSRIASLSVQHISVIKHLARDLASCSIIAKIIIKNILPSPRCVHH